MLSQLTISNVTEKDSGEYTCSVQGNSTTVTLIIAGIVNPFHCLCFPTFVVIVDPTQRDCNCSKHFQCFVVQQCTVQYYNHGRRSDRWSDGVVSTAGYLTDYQHTGHDLLYLPAESEVNTESR